MLLRIQWDPCQCRAWTCFWSIRLRCPRQLSLLALLLPAASPGPAILCTCLATLMLGLLALLAAVVVR